MQRVREYVADSPFEYQKNCLLYLPKEFEDMQKRKSGKNRDDRLAISIRLICFDLRAYAGAVLSYHLMGNVYQMLRG